jgi:uncharacterized protein YfaS (alpha-2-macroglobulin family)
MLRRSLALVSFAAAASLAACGQPSDPPKAPVAAAGADAVAATPEGAPPRPPLTARRLAPVLQESGVEGVLPGALVIELGVPVVEPERVGEISARSVLEADPPVSGTLRWSGPSTLTFTPARPLEYATRYRFTLAKIETPDGPIGAAEGESWTRELTTPGFAFLGWSPVDLDLTRKSVVFELTFSGPVLANRARGSLAVTVDGKSAQTLSVSATRAPHVLRLAVTDPRVSLGAKLRLAVKKGLPSLGDAMAAAAGAELVVSDDKAIVIKGAVVQEGPQGFYIEVVCDDKAAERGSRSFYDGGLDEYGLSSRCELREEALARVKVEPEVKRVWMGPGRAGFRIFGDMKRGVVKLSIPAGVTSVDGGVLLAPFQRSFSVPARRPQLSFVASGRYLPRSAWKELAVRHLNVEEVKLAVRHVPPENLVFWLGEDSSDRADERTSNLLVEKTLPLRAERDTPGTSYLDVASLLPAATRGVLELRLSGVGATATSRLLLTSMSLIAKKTAPPKEPWKQQVTVWALDADSTALLDGVEVSLVRKSGKVVARCATAGARGCALEAAAGDADPDRSPPFALVARKGDDLTYLRWRDLKTEAADAHTAGAAYQLESPYRAAMWSDRGVYRPGDTAHVVALLRGRDDLAPPQPLPVELKLVDPRGKVARKLVMKTNPAGLVVLDHPFGAFADTGGWRVELAVADRAVSQHVLQVEEFVPERMKVTLEPTREDLAADEEASFRVAARYLFGGNAGGSGVELNCRLEPERFAPDANGDLTYGVEPSGKAVSLGEVHGELSADGTALLSCADTGGDTGVTQTAALTARVGVLEAGGGRATTQSATATVHPERYYLGIKADAERVASGRPFTVTGLVVDWKGQPMSSPGAVQEVTVETLHLEAEYAHAYDEEDGESSVERHVHAVPEGKTRVAVTGGRFTATITPGDASIGTRVRVSAGRAVTELDLDGEYPYYADGYEESGGSVDMTPRPARPTKLVLDVPAEARVGQPLAVKLKAPYRGKILFAVETDRLVSFEWKEVSGGEVSWSYTPAAFAPNLYVSAFLVKDPHAESAQAYLPDRAFGMTSVRVAPVEFQTDLKVSAPAEVRSGSPLAIDIDTGPTDGTTFATVAVVDEGILSLTGFATPNPLAALFAKRALGVETFETIGWTLLHQPQGTSSRTGGGDDEEAGEGDLAEGRVQPVKPVAFFVGPLAVGATGKLQVAIDVPQYRGELRVMVVTAGPKKIGRAEARVTVKDPLVVQVTLPRFVTHDDELQLPVFLTNLSGAPLDVDVALAAEPLPVPGMTAASGAAAPIQFLGKDRGAVRLADGASQTVVFQVKAAIPVGAAKLRVVARGKGKAGSFEARDDVDVPFLAAGPRERVVHKLTVSAGTTDLAPSLRGWLPTSERTTFWLTSNPYGESFDHLKYLIRYPYGCVEQTTSSTRPLLFVGNLVEQIDPELAEQKLEDMVLAGVNRLLSMQTPSGGLGYWPGDNQPVDWGTAYATHLLLDARKLGYPVPEDRLDDILAWIDARVAQLEREPARAKGGWRHDEQAEAYLHYVLALAGKGKKARMQKLLALVPSEARAELAENAYLLRAALWLAGDRRHERELRALDLSDISDERRNSWSFYSDRRRRALMLSTYVDLFGKGPEGEALAQRVAAALTRESSHYTTQELVWGVTGLGKWVAGGARDFKPGKLVADGKEIKPRPTKARGSDRSWALVRASEYPSLTLEVPEKGEGDLYLVISSEGVRERSEAKIGGDGLALRRTYRALDGAERSLEDGSVILGDIVFVELELENTSRERIQNIALVDRLPAGFEIENPRLGRGATAEWISEDHQWEVDYLSLRDDRLEAFGALGPREKKTIVYTVRATTAGKTTIPPVEAGAMYDPTRWARDRARTLVVTGPWEGKLL